MPPAVVSPQPLTPSLLLQRMHAMNDSDDDSQPSIDRVILSDEDDGDNDHLAEMDLSVIVSPTKTPRTVMQDATLHVIQTIHRTLDYLRTDLVSLISLPTSYLPESLQPTALQRYIIKDLSRRIATTREAITDGVAADVERVFAQESFLRDDMQSVEEEWEKFHHWAEEYIVQRVAMVIEAFQLYVIEGIPRLFNRFVNATLAEGMKYYAGGLSGVQWVQSCIQQMINSISCKTDWLLSHIREFVRQELAVGTRRYAA